MGYGTEECVDVTTIPGTPFMNIKAIFPVPVEMVSFEKNDISIVNLDDGNVVFSVSILNPQGGVIPDTDIDISTATVTTERKAIGSASWVALVSPAVKGKANGLITATEVVNTPDYAEGDMGRIVISGAKVTVGSTIVSLPDIEFYFKIISSTGGGSSGGGSATSATVSTTITFTDTDNRDLLNGTKTLQEIKPSLLDVTFDNTIARATIEVKVNLKNLVASDVVVIEKLSLWGASLDDEEIFTFTGVQSPKVVTFKFDCANDEYIKLQARQTATGIGGYKEIYVKYGSICNNPYAP